MSTYDREIPLRCLFCSSELQAPEDAEYESGDMIECLECGESNDYDSLIEVAKEQGVAEVKEDVQRDIKRQLEKALKKGR